MKDLRLWHKTFVRVTPDAEPVKVEIHGDLTYFADILGKKAAQNRSGKASVMGGLIVAKVVKSKKEAA